MTTLAKNKLWTELYRPQTLNDICLPSRIKSIFESDSIIQNYLFYGHQGTGKTSLAKIIAKKYNALIINASLQNNVDTIRTQIDNFCALQSLDNYGFKVVLMDEADHLSQQSQAALRGVIETYSDTTRFIFTCNFVDKLLDPIKSRLEPINFDFIDANEQKEQTANYIKRLVYIAHEHNMQIDKDALAHIYKKSYPDMRSMISNLESLYKSGVMHVTLADVTKTIGLKYEDLFKFLCNMPMSTALYSTLSAYKGKEHYILKELSYNFVTYCASQPQYASKLGDIAIKVHKYSVESKQCIDPFVTLLACCYELTLILK